MGSYGGVAIMLAPDVVERLEARNLLQYMKLINKYINGYPFDTRFLAR
jgi:hypothetical protein